MEPPWSMLGSTMTLPGFMVLTISRVMSLGAFAPGMRAPLTTRSALGSKFLMLAELETRVVTLAGRTSLRYLRRSILTSNIKT